MSAEVRLKECRTALQQRGVKDVKFLFGALSEKPLSQVASDVADALEAVNSGKFHELPKLDDSSRI